MSPVRPPWGCLSSLFKCHVSKGHGSWLEAAVAGGICCSQMLGRSTAPCFSSERIQVCNHCTWSVNSVPDEPSCGVNPKSLAHHSCLDGQPSAPCTARGPECWGRAIIPYLPPCWDLKYLSFSYSSYWFPALGAVLWGEFLLYTSLSRGILPI